MMMIASVLLSKRYALSYRIVFVTSGNRNSILRRHVGGRSITCDKEKSSQRNDVIGR